MSEPDAVPLPREGDVFFDVRGDARSMRLSWYADSGVAVFSIWQAERCTGTFRLPFSDLARMVQTLTHGPRLEAGGTARPGRTVMTGQHSYDADLYQSAYRPASSEPATSAYNSADLPGYAGYGELPGYGDIPGYEPVPDYPDLPGYGAAPGYDAAAGYGAPDLASHPYQPGHSYGAEPDRGHHDRVQADRVQADRIQAARALSAAASQGEWLAAPAAASGWDSVAAEPSATPGLMSFPAGLARNGPAASDSGRASGY